MKRLFVPHGPYSVGKNKYCPGLYFLLGVIALWIGKGFFKRGDLKHPIAPVEQAGASWWQFRISMYIPAQVGVSN